MTIRILSSQVAAKIAAGEVVERPASVVKELIENSLDAGSSNIIVEVSRDTGKGIKLIRVVDNGTGINPLEIERAFHRHATSKITSEADLEQITTLGFRGEALPSIAAVSKIHMSTHEPMAAQGCEIRLEWGTIKTIEPYGGPTGTSITITDLLKNVPARLKFLRSEKSELGRINDLISRYLMTFPEIRFRFIVDGHDRLISSGNGNLLESIASVYGNEIASNMLPLSWKESSGNYEINGYISPPSLTRSNRSLITFFANRRWVQNHTLSIALQEAYGTVLPIKRYPIAILNITVPSHELDVNVHPTKREVRFLREDRIFSTIRNGVRDTLINLSPAPEIYSESINPGFLKPMELNAIQPSLHWSYEYSYAKVDDQNASPRNMSFLNVLGQAKRTYVVTEGADGIFLLDQHASHERILFEKVLQEMSEGKPSIQTLLEPIPVELPPTEWELVTDQLQELKRYGFILDDFGEKSYLLRTVPSIFKGFAPDRALLDVIGMANNENRLQNRQEVLAASIACHGSIRAGMELTHEEMNELLSLLSKSKNPHTCPHGRPTMVRLTFGYLEKEFGRT